MKIEVRGPELLTQRFASGAHIITSKELVLMPRKCVLSREYICEKKMIAAIFGADAVLRVARAQ